MEQERTPVRLKGVGKSLCVSIDPREPLDYLQEEITRLFNELKHEPSESRVTIDVGDEDGYKDVIEHLTAFLKDNFGVGSVSRTPKKAPVTRRSAGTEKRNRKRDMDQSWHHHRTDVLMLAGRVRSGQKVTARNHLVIMGDVNPGAEVIAGGDILIMGSLLGTAIAGQPDNEDNIVLALDFRPTQIQIARYVAAGLPSSPGKVTEFAHVENGSIVVENYLDANPFGRLPWPEAR